VKSNDGGLSWKAVSLVGKVDFHFLEVAGGHIDAGFRHALLLQVGLVSIFLLITFFLPKKAVGNTEYAH